MNEFIFKTEFKDTLTTALDEVGVSLKTDINEVVLYAEGRTHYLTTLVGQPGYQMAVIAERDNIALKAGISTSLAADASDQRITGVIHSFIGVAAKAMILA